jgi:hypothetical protein
VCGVAASVAAAAPPSVGFSGTYAVTIKVTNTKYPDSHWIISPVKPCAAPCSAVDFHQRLTTEKAWRKSTLHFAWQAGGFKVRKVLRRFSDCQPPKGKAVKLGYDVTSTETLKTLHAVNGVVTSFTGDGLDSYVPNAAGKAAGCKPGAYVYSISGKRQ